MTDTITNVTDSNFKPEVLDPQIPVLVYFWAEWCGPCKMMTGIIEDVANGYAGLIKVVKLNIDDNVATAPKYGIRGIPTLLLFKDGEVVDTNIGAMTKAQIVQFIDRNL